MEELINKHLLRMKSLQSVYDKNTGQYNVLGILINELTEQLRTHYVLGQSEQLKCGNSNPPCAPNIKFGYLECMECDWSE